MKQSDDVVRPIRRFDMQWRPNYITKQRRLVLTRIYWNWGKPGFGGSSNKLSFSVCFDWKDILLGLEIRPELWGFIVYLYLFPFLSLRVHLRRAYGGYLF